MVVCLLHKSTCSFNFAYLRFYVGTISSCSSYRKSKHKKTNKVIDSHQKNQKDHHGRNSSYLYGRSICQISMEASKRPISRVLLKSTWELSPPDDKRINSICTIAEKKGISVEFKPISHLYNISDGRPHQGVCLEVGNLSVFPMRPELLNKLINTENTSRLPLWVLLYDIHDPVNVGTILRTCSFLGVTNVLMTSRCAPLTAVACKASAGATELVNLYTIGNSMEFMKALMKLGWDVLGSGTNADSYEVDDDADNFCESYHKSIDMPGNLLPPMCDINTVKITKPSLLVLGNEGSGISTAVLNTCSKIVNVNPSPQCMTPSSVSCLNVSTAAAIILHRLLNH
ncbi:rRNA methyltransferase 1, mitochondrial-like [Clavelina lepadiformis]|uniref:rRNA methyltransferase 1, mitochondrial-like n=1 Tax=Clavelina lepadiformis TaxID=159417 RepID=UPI0040437FDA